MNRVFALLPLIVCSMLTGCFFGSSPSGTVQKPSSSAILTNLPEAQLNFKIKMPASLKTALRAATSVSAVFELNLINHGDTANPFTLMRKKCIFSITRQEV